MPDLVDVNTLPLAQAYRIMSRGGLVHRLMHLSRQEDLGLGIGRDATSLVCLEEDRPMTAHVVMRESGIVAGLAAMSELLDVFAQGATFQVKIPDGANADTGDVIGTVSGNAPNIVGAERTMLNLIGRLSGIATRTAEFVEVIAGTNAKLLDTRKTTPGLRVLEKYAVRCGGGYCHRIGLHDAVLVKDNHLAGIEDDQLCVHVTKLARRARAVPGGAVSFVEIEVDRLEQLDEVLKVEPGLVQFVLLDNMNLRSLRSAVSRRKKSGSEIQLEASGGVTLETIRKIAETGVDRISVGSLTHGARSLDVALDAEPAR